MKNNVNIGQLLSDYIKENSVSKAALSRALEISDSNLNSKLHRAAMRTDVLSKICVALEHNFFADIAARFPSDYSTDVPADTSKEEEIKALQLEILILEREKENLSAIISGSMALGNAK